MHTQQQWSGHAQSDGNSHKPHCWIFISEFINKLYCRESLRMATEESKDVEMKDVDGEEKEVDPKQAQIDKDLLTFEGLSFSI